MALTLQESPILDYSVGFYTSLVPRHLAGTPRIAAMADALTSVLSRAEAEGRELHVFAWTRRGERRGVILAPAELPGFHDLAKVTQAHMVT